MDSIEDIRIELIKAENYLKNDPSAAFSKTCTCLEELMRKIIGKCRESLPADDVRAICDAEEKICLTGQVREVNGTGHDGEARELSR